MVAHRRAGTGATQNSRAPLELFVTLEVAAVLRHQSHARREADRRGRRQYSRARPVHAADRERRLPSELACLPRSLTCASTGRSAARCRAPHSAPVSRCGVKERMMDRYLATHLRDAPGHPFDACTLRVMARLRA